MVISVVFGFISAMLFGLAAPLSKILLEGLNPFQLAGLLYVGAAIGLLPKVIAEKGFRKVFRMDRNNKKMLAGAVLLGGVAGPVALLFGLEIAEASSVSMWLNLELVFTALLGHFIFRDYLGKLGWLGVLGAVFAAGLLSWQGGMAGITAGLLVGAACLFWGFDNHFTALIDEISPATNTFFKGLFAGPINLFIGFAAGSFVGGTRMIGYSLILGVFSYGVSIVLYISSAQGIGATRAQVIFAASPFFGVGASLLLLNETFSFFQVTAAGLLILSLIPILIDNHLHSHFHETTTHQHLHGHGEGHHKHSHDNIYLPSWFPHTHEHEHEGQGHSHPHVPDIHHRHKHEE